VVSTADRSCALKEEMAKKQGDLKIKEIFLTKILPLARGVRWPQQVTDEGVSMASLAGIAFSSEVPPIDLIPEDITETQKKRDYQRQVVVSGIWVTAALISLALALGVGFFRKNVELMQLQSQLRETKHDASGIEERLKKIHDIEGMLRNRLVFSDLAREFSRILPAQAYLVNMSIGEGNTLSLEGVSSNPVEINQFQRAMVDSKNFSHVSLDYVNKRVTQEGEVDYFKITCTYNPLNNLK